MLAICQIGRLLNTIIFLTNKKKKKPDGSQNVDFPNITRSFYFYLGIFKNLLLTLFSFQAV